MDPSTHWAPISDDGMSEAVVGPQTNRGQILKLTDEEYFASYGEFMTSHKLMKFAKCPYGYFAEFVDGTAPPRKESSALVFGSAAHALILEGQSAFRRRYFTGNGPINPRTDKPYGRDTGKFEAWLAEHVDEDGRQKEFLTNEEHNRLLQMSCSVREHDYAARLLMDGEPEVAVRAELFGTRAQGKLDWVNHKTKRIVDLKTIQNITKFEKDFGLYQYNLQAAFYVSLLHAATGEDYDFTFVAVEKEFPFRTGVWHVSNSTLVENINKVSTLLGYYRNCVVSDNWPTGYEQVRVL